MTQSAHTPTPWEFDEGLTIHAPHQNKEIIACLTDDDGCNYADTREIGEANAAHIVKCVNAHDELIKALKFYANPLRQRETKIVPVEVSPVAAAMVNAPLETMIIYNDGQIARDALAKAGA